MSEGQGSITYSAPSGGPAGSIPFLGARNGASLDTDGFVVLGNLTTDATDPAKLLDDRRIEMQDFVLEWATDNNTAWNWTLNNQNGGGGNQIPTSWISPASSNWAVWQPGNYGTAYTDFGTAGRFQSGYSIYPDVNEPVTDRPNVVGMLWGYNTSFTQGRIDDTEAAFRFATETFFVIGEDPYFEFHIPEITTTDGHIWRVNSWYIDRVTGIGFQEQVINDVQWFNTGSDPASAPFYAHLEYDPGGDTSKFQIESLFTNGVAELTVGNAAGDGGFIMTVQGGETSITTPAEFDVSAFRIFFTPLQYTGIVNSMVVSDSILNAPNGDALIDVQSTTMGIRFPTMTTTQRLAIAAVVGVGGLQVFDSTLNKMAFWDGAAWQIITSV